MRGKTLAGHWNWKSLRWNRMLFSVRCVVGTKYCRMERSSEVLSHWRCRHRFAVPQVWSDGMAYAAGGMIGERQASCSRSLDVGIARMV